MRGGTLGAAPVTICATLPAVERTVFCLLVGVDAYGPPVDLPLNGCLNDMRHLEQYLRGRLGDAANILTLADDKATREGVVAGFRSHLAQAGSGDIALFSYSGHGSQELPPTEFAFGDASGKLQNLLLFDAGHDNAGQFVWPLADKELGLLLDEVAAGGAHVVAMLDCCHSGDGTRDAFVTVRQWIPTTSRNADPGVQTAIEKLKGPRPLDGFLDGTLQHFQSTSATGHVALTACQSSELAKELIIGDEHRGAFTATMIEVLETVGDKADYRSVIAAVRSRLERTVERQRPGVHPLDAGGLGDRQVPRRHHRTRSAVVPDDEVRGRLVDRRRRRARAAGSRRWRGVPVRMPPARRHAVRTGPRASRWSPDRRGWSRWVGSRPTPRTGR